MHDPRDIVTKQSFRVHPELMGQALASPTRRGFALMIDVAFAATMSKMFGVVVGIVAGAACVRSALQVPKGTAGANLKRWSLVGLGLLFVLGTVRSSEDATEEAPPVEVTVETSTTSETRTDVSAEEAMAVAARVLAAVEAESKEAKTSTLGASAAPIHSELVRIRKQLDRIEVAPPAEPAAPEPEEWTMEAWVDRILETLGLTVSWMGLYFTLFVAYWKGQTPGKRLLGIRVVRLDGAPISLWNAFERFSGYTAGLATGLLGFAQIFWDPNRQAIQDKIVSTVVIRGALISDSGSDEG